MALWGHPISLIPCAILESLPDQLRLIARLPEGGLREHLAAAALIPASWKLARLIRERGIDFAHGHSFGNTGYILRMAHEILSFR